MVGHGGGQDQAQDLQYHQPRPDTPQDCRVERRQAVRLQLPALWVQAVQSLSDGGRAVLRLLELVFDDTPHVSEYAEQVIKFMVSQGAEETK